MTLETVAHLRLRRGCGDSEPFPLKDGRTDMEALAAMLNKDVACVLLQSPNYFGLIEDGETVAKIVARTTVPSSS